MPIFRSTRPSSCVQCHLSSVDLKDYIKPSSEQTFVSLRDQGLIDLEKPLESKILQLIEMGEDDYDKGARLIHEKVRKQEYEAFANWIVACCKDDRLARLPKANEKDFARPEAPLDVIRHGRKSRVLNSFVRNIWSQRMRCFPCHTPSEIKPDQTKIRDRFDDFEVEFGDRMVLFKKTPAETMKYWLERSADAGNDELPLVNLKDPRKSLVVLKPTARLPRKIGDRFEPPSYKEPVSHMGGLKMHVDDQSYKSFIAWIKDYAKIKSGEYKESDQLPSDNWFATKRVLRLTDTSPEWKVGTPVQLMIHRWQEDASRWSPDPIAFTQGTVTPRHMVNGALFLLAPADPAKRLEWFRSGNKFKPGKYLVKVYVDKTDRLRREPEILLGPDELAGEVVIPHAQWKIGFPKAEKVSFAHKR